MLDMTVVRRKRKINGKAEGDLHSLSWVASANASSVTIIRLPQADKQGSRKVRATNSLVDREAIGKKRAAFRCFPGNYALINRITASRICRA